MLNRVLSLRGSKGLRPLKIPAGGSRNTLHRPEEPLVTTQGGPLKGHQLVFEEADDFGFRQHVEVQLKADHGWGGIGIHLQVAAYGEDGEEVTVRMITLRGTRAGVFPGANVITDRDRACGQLA